MSISLRLAIPACPAPVLPRQKARPAGNGGSPVARVALRTGALRGCASLPLRPQPLSMDVGVGQPCRRRRAAAVCYASAHLSARTMQWISAGATAYHLVTDSIGNNLLSPIQLATETSSVAYAPLGRAIQGFRSLSSIQLVKVLLLAKGTAIHKSFLVPLFALQAPCSVISWIKSDYGQWTAFLALLVRLFFFIPGELELPLSTMLLVSIAPYQLMNLRGTQGGAVLSLALAGYLAFQHFTRVSGLGKAFDQGSIIATLAIISITIIPLILLF